jgi:hypothetical protein
MLPAQSVFHRHKQMAVSRRNGACGNELHSFQIAMGPGIVVLQGKVVLVSGLTLGIRPFSLAKCREVAVRVSGNPG